MDEGKEELRVDIIRDELARTGLSIQDVASVIRSAYDGETATEIKRIDEDEDIDVVVKLPEEARRRETIDRIFITNTRGDRVPLSRVAKFSKGIGPLFVLRYGGKRAVTVTADIDTDINTSQAINALLAGWIEEELKKHPGVTHKFGGEEEDRVKSVGSLIKAMILSGLIIYLLIATLFQSFGQPFIVMSVIPFSFIGVFFTLLIHRLPLSILVMVGMTGLMGVVVNNSILMVEAINRIKKTISDPIEGVVHAAVTRLRPIFLTTITTFFGIIPLGYGIGGKEPFLEHVALIFGWGLAFTSVITIFLVPSLYAMYHTLLRKIIGVRP